jgi:predicted homoserine dehydrogenase-like protein
MAEIRIGLVGTGFIARHLALEVGRRDGYRIERVLTRRPSPVEGFDSDIVTGSVEDLVAHSDLVVECTGDAIWATDVIASAIGAGLPVVTMNTEFHITCGSAFVGRGIVTEAAGDQPGCLAELHEEAVDLGFRPLVYGNMKGFLNEDPEPDDMAYWGEKQGISLPMVTSFTDGTKVQAEQVLVGNHFGATIAKENLLGPAIDDLSVAGEALAAEAERLGRPITDYVLSRSLPHGVFLVATHDERQRDALSYYKLGDGPHYVLIRNNIFVHLEILKTVRRVLTEGTVLLDNSASPELSLATVAKRDLEPGQKIANGIGSFDVRGTAIRIVDHPRHVPIGLMQDATIERPIARGELLDWSTVSVPDSEAVRIWRTTIL